MYLTAYEPWNLISQWQNALGPEQTEPRVHRDSLGERATWHPACDIQDLADRFVLYADIPGVASDDIEVTADKGVLTISGKRGRVDEDADQQGRVERAHGDFSRRFTLPDSVETDAIEASYNDGVLKVTLPKQAEVQPKRIKIN
ncbi:MAG TPA: Hsp20/alpha crystallin family protein [Chromatiaceae bacterium]|jgi:HSP20 family protein|nr:Hsp20/alpha crystallin family protein [Chromatiaceae bacterium]HIN81967.1 Hsp20/alpha crystallin family protein [Chromatiales bacterium]HIA08654.1 Hsp20/alpha crystallin family protein [Chromatiaceae bacterium]HIB83400.1 Hsp20/alpha crystallin family protein [Chromatiaceae bacterium]HIO14332.1 Hsp20/alpha crystallin family protein [Chromatiales bacterium]